MNLRIAPVPRRFPWPVWAAAIVLLWVALVAAVVLLTQRVGQHVDLCLFKRVTHVPCPTCGSGRGLLRMLGGDLPGAIRCNPLVFCATILCGLGLLLRVVCGKAIRLDLSRRQRRGAWIAAAILFALNWAYVILFVG